MIAGDYCPGDLSVGIADASVPRGFIAVSCS